MKHLLLTTIAAVLVGCGESPKEISIHDAAAAGDIEAVKQHLAAGTDVNAKADGGVTPLIWAASNGHKEVIELLIANGADRNAKDLNGRTPLHYATFGYNETVELLLANGADVNAKNDDGVTPLDTAIVGFAFVARGEVIMHKHPETVDLLRKHGGKTGEELKAEGK